ncbi:MAG TPA: hypothetical protein ENK00_01560 [Chromatiales bacterium]|nr:hypothetical protein [Chromatiales bacterium]
MPAGRARPAWPKLGGRARGCADLLAVAAGVGRAGAGAAVDRPAAGQALREGLPAEARARVAIKWPNDLVVGLRKLAGILAQSRSRGDRARLVLGVGINVRAAPKVAGRDTVSLADLGACPIRETLLVALVGALGEALREPLEPQRIRAAWSREVDALHGRPVRTESGLAGLGQGLAPDGSYRLHTGTGECAVSASDRIVQW